MLEKVVADLNVSHKWFKVVVLLYHLALLSFITLLLQQPTMILA